MGRPLTALEAPPPVALEVAGSAGARFEARRFAPIQATGRRT